MSLIKFEVVTPERVLFQEEAESLSVPTKMGEITILPQHIPLVASLAPGVMNVRLPGGVEEVVSLSGGFIEVLKDKVVILADTAERAAELDESRLEEARRRAEEMRHEVKREDRLRFTEASLRLAKEMARSNALKRWRKLKS